jgi:uncharacterized protein
MYIQGLGVTRDYTEAIRWFSMAANQGDGLAQAKLALMFQDGEGTPRDYVQSYKWFGLAAARSAGLEQVRFAAMRDGLAGKMTSAQVELARQLTEEWKPSK